MAWVTISDDFSVLEDAKIVVESTIESIDVKRQVIRNIEAAVSAGALIRSNRSAIPVTFLQQKAQHPGRILGLHWAGPANFTRFMEIICGKETLLKNAQKAVHLARQWRKEPSLGFINILQPRQTAGKSCSWNSATRFAILLESIRKISETEHPKPKAKNSTFAFAVRTRLAGRARSTAVDWPFGLPLLPCIYRKVVDDGSRLALNVVFAATRWSANK
jgi:3-hydroxyacyl-CoA dehydrogenase, NAD binding domain